MLKHAKYEMLRWLLDDICSKSKCKTCQMKTDDGYTCASTNALHQARNIWGLKEEKR